MAKAADAFLTGRPYGIRLDFKHKGFALFNYNMNELGNHLPGRLETLPLEDFDVEDNFGNSHEMEFDFNNSNTSETESDSVPAVSPSTSKQIRE